MAVVTAPTFDTVYGVKEALICNLALARIGIDPIRDTDEDSKQSAACKAAYPAARDRLFRSHPFNFCTKSSLVGEDESYQFGKNGFAYAYKSEDRKSFSGVNDTDEVIASIPEAGSVGGIVLDDSILGRVVIGTNVPQNATIIAYDEVARTITLDRPTTDEVTSFTMVIPVVAIWSVGSNKDNRFEVFGGGASQRVFTNIVSETIDLVRHVDIKYSSRVIDPDLFDDAYKDALVIKIAYDVCLNLTKNGNLFLALGNEYRSLLEAAKVSSSKEKQKFSAEEPWTERSGEPLALVYGGKK